MFLLHTVFTGYETNNKYVVKNSVGQKIFFAAEDSGCCERYWCNNLRSFEMNILDNFGNEVIHIHRPLACQSCLYPCCLQVSIYFITLDFHRERIAINSIGGTYRKWKFLLLLVT